ncbi:MAG: hydantoinase/oxoprolinase family protein [Alphaproteobacteria bacterium]|nr:hydantoinase/oxoprolinase family protein [Alphaproteobacteria bacterium]
MATAPYRLAIDVGGTFTDVVVVDDRDASLRFGKVLSTPADPSEGSLAGATDTLARHAIAPGDVGEVIHATTVATNAVLERKGAATGLITTKGFRDALEMGRESRYDIYDLGLRLPEPLVPRQLRTEVDERLDHEGGVVRALDEATVAPAVRRLLDAGVRAIAISLLHSYVNPAHERRLVELVRAAAPDVEISVSHEVAGEVREYERTSTVVVDAYVKPLVRRYVERLADGLGRAGLPAQPALMLSHGGVGSATEVVKRFPVRMIESGPAAGAIAAAFFARQALPGGDAIAFDMGGTTAKMSLILDGMPSVTHQYEVAHVHRFKHGSGIPLQISAIELLEIGAGGGSIAHLNDLGLLNVGPHSAGAVPGPACYGRGGDRPTVTDADLVLGYLDPGHFLGGEMKLDVAAARGAIDRTLAQPLGMAVDAVAWGIHDVVNESMAAAIRAHAAEKGVDLRRFGLVAFGGAGPLHAEAIARKLGVGRVVCPFGAGVASAIGCLVASPAADLVSSYAALLPAADWPEIGRRFAAMERDAGAMIAALVGEGAATVLHAAFEMRCEGQGYSVIVEAPLGAAVDAGLRPELESRFVAAYARVYGHRPPRGVALELVSLRARVEHPRPPRELRLWRPATTGAAALKGRRRAYFPSAGGYVEAGVYDRYALPGGEWFQGPAIVEERETSTVVGPGARFHHDEAGHLVIELPATEAAP